MILYLLVSLPIGAPEGPLIGCMHVRGVHKTQHAKHEAKFASFDSVDIYFNESYLFSNQVDPRLDTVRGTKTEIGPLMVLWRAANGNGNCVSQSSDLQRRFLNRCQLS